MPEPILLHPLKHHLGYLQAYVSESEDLPVAKLAADLLSIGNASQLDVYTGTLSVQQIADEVILYLQQYGLLAPAAYHLYLSAEGATYRLLTLSDGTDWVLRWGEVAGRHVHLHPARYALHTIRVKANALKTAAAVSIASRRLKVVPDLPLCNQVRAEWLLLPPVKIFNEADSTTRLVALLKND
ncbi:hypothetical protein [Pontibacter chitinilyticus]|uniref:hypothetical protein n=1 Tax=Pontibacter chitinilyticus TaxID=2674989 RepID=UPI00321A99C5